MTAAPSSRRAAGLVSSALFGLSLVAATWGFHYRPGDYPPWLDYDSAALGIFVNNISYREHYDAVFRDSTKAANVFRASWAASFLPAMAPLSVVQRALDIPPDRVGSILEGAGILFGVLGTLCAALLARGGGRGPLDVLLLFGIVASVPPFLLYVRTAVPNFLYSYFMFWLAVFCLDRYFAGRAGGTPANGADAATRPPARRWIYALGIVLALYAMVPYVPIAVLPVVALLLALWRRAFARAVRDPHLYAAGFVSLALFASLRFLVGTTFEPSYEAWQTKTLPYLADRAGHAISLEYLDPSLLPAKLAKLAHQHVWFARDQLGDRTRSDAMWTVPAPQWPWLALLALAAFGMWRSRRDGDPAAAPFTAVLFATYGLALTVSFPEGRYMIPAIPALAFFAVQGLRAAVPARTPRTLAGAAVLAAMAWTSFALVSGPYDAWIVKQWQNRAGLRETVARIRERADGDYGIGRELPLAWPEMNHEVWLYLQMLTNLRARLYELDDDLDREAAGNPLFAAVRKDEAAKVDDVKKLGFASLGEVQDPVTGRKLEVLVRDR
jgi:4-amino-4-deoxy-L-arabinose transferase-like glycosyltransferase